MCGIAGEIRFDQKASDHAAVKRMCDAQNHRGPDDEGYYYWGPVSMGIRRLAIIDLTKGIYPLTNEDHTLHLVFNGEIYGFPELRKMLESLGHTFSTNTDAEVIVHGFEEWGLVECLEKIRGMFAFALWDDCQGLLWLARDRFGIKPLYYHVGDGFFTFASEIKAILARGDVERSPNGDILTAYINQSLIDHTPYTFFSKIMQLPAGHYMRLSPTGDYQIIRYWAPQISSDITREGSIETEAEAIRALFADAVREQLVSDVPVGSCLSGGIDSSSIVCAINMVRQDTDPPMKVFSAVFPNERVDETRYAETVAKATNANWHFVEPTANELWRDLPELVRCQEEPAYSPSIYAQFRVMKLASEQGITVLLDGQGGDELLCGYIPQMVDYLRTLKDRHDYVRLIREYLAARDLVGPYLNSKIRHYLKSRAEKAVKLLSLRGQAASGQVSGHGHRMPTDLSSRLEDLLTRNGLPALLRYEDRSSMWWSIEARVPFLHEPFVNLVTQLPLDRKIRNGWTKFILREAMKGILPEKVRLRRSKIGFETPDNWLDQLRGNMREVFCSSAKASKFYDLRQVLSLLEKEGSLTPNERSYLWRCLNLELWRREFML